MADEADQHTQIMTAAKTSLRNVQAGGRRNVSIGRGSAELKRKHLVRKVKLIAASIGVIVLAAMVAGLVIDGIGFTGIMVALLAVVAVTFLFSNFPRMKMPKRTDLNRGDVRQLVGRTELWLEHQRPALPPPAVTLVDQIGVQLDGLGAQLQGVNQSHPSAVEVRRLVGEHLPEMVDSYRKIPAHLRKEQRAGGTPDDQLVESLGRISGEIDSVTRQLAQGSIDDLAIRTRYLDYKYGGMEEPAVKDS